MRLKNVKGSRERIAANEYALKDVEQHKGSWKEFFGDGKPIHIEIGMGKGQFVINNALNNPNINYIGIEKYDSVIAKGLQKIPEGLNNLVMVLVIQLN